MTQNEYADAIGRERAKINEALGLIREASENLMALKNTLVAEYIKEVAQCNTKTNQ